MRAQECGRSHAQGLPSSRQLRFHRFSRDSWRFQPLFAFRHAIFAMFPLDFWLRSKKTGPLEEYMALGCPSTDFPLTVFMRRCLSGGPEAAEEGVRGACCRANKALKASEAAQEGSALSNDSVRFARNHDTAPRTMMRVYTVDMTCFSRHVRRIIYRRYIELFKTPCIYIYIVYT